SARRGGFTEQHQCLRTSRIDIAPFQGSERAPRTVFVPPENLQKTVSGARKGEAEAAGVEPAIGIDKTHLTKLSAFDILDDDPVPGSHLDHRRSTPLDAVALHAGRQRRHARSQYRARPWRHQG